MGRARGVTWELPPHAPPNADPKVKSRGQECAGTEEQRHTGGERREAKGRPGRHRQNRSGVAKVQAPLFSSPWGARRRVPSTARDSPDVRSHVPPVQSLPKPRRPRETPQPQPLPSRSTAGLLQVDVLCGAGVLQVALVVLQEGAAGGESVLSPRLPRPACLGLPVSPPASLLSPPGPGPFPYSLASMLPSHPHPRGQGARDVPTPRTSLHAPAPSALPTTFPTLHHHHGHLAFPPCPSPVSLNLTSIPPPSLLTPWAPLHWFCIPTPVPAITPHWPNPNPATHPPDPLTPHSGPRASSTPGRRKRGRQNGSAAGVW